MSLLNFFAQQRKRWQSQPADDQSADYLAGGKTALEQAEAAFKATPLYNVHQRLADAQHELEEVSYQLSVARKEVKNLGSKLASMTQQASAVVVEQQLVATARLHRNRMRSARRVMRRIVAVAVLEAMHSDIKLEKILELVRRFQLAIHSGEEENGE